MSPKKTRQRKQNQADWADWDATNTDSTNLEHSRQQCNESCIMQLELLGGVVGFSTPCVNDRKQVVHQATAGSFGRRCRAGTQWDVCLHREESITPDSVSGSSHCFFTKGDEVEPCSVDRYTNLLYFGPRFNLANDAELILVTNAYKSNMSTI